MNLGKFFKKKTEEAKDVSPPTNDTAYSSSAIYSHAHFERYNPDELLNTRGYNVYDKIAKDEQVKAAMRFRRESVTGRRWFLSYPQNGGRNLSDEEKEKRSVILTEALKNVEGNFAAKLNYIMSSMKYGFSMTEKIYSAFDFDGVAYWGLKDLKKKPYHTFYFNTDQYGNLAKLVQRVDGKEIELDIERFIHHVHNPDEDIFYGQSELREAYRSWFSKDVLIKLENMYLERMSGGFVWAQPSADADINLKTGTKPFSDLQNILRNITTKTGILLPKGIDLNVQSPSSTDAFQKAIQYHDKALAKTLLMPNLLGFSEQGQTGSYSQSQTQLEAFLWLLETEKSALEETINDQMIKELNWYNFGDKDAPLFQFAPLSQTMIDRVVNMWTALAQSGVVQSTEEDESYIRDLLSFPEKSGDVLTSEDDEPGLEPEPGPDDETIVGALVSSNSLGETIERALRASEKRVDFSRIERSSETVSFVAINSISASVRKIIDWANEKLLSSSDPLAVQKIKLPASLVTDIKKQSLAALKDAWSIGSDSGMKELSKAGKRFTASDVKKFDSLGDLAKRYMEGKAFRMAGDITGAVEKIIKAEVLQGLKVGKSQQEVMNAVVSSIAKAGLVAVEDVMDLISESLDIKNPEHRLSTLMRTATFEAINEARFNLFTDGDNMNFVRGLRYSAIIDSRTTEICQHLDDRVYEKNRDLWNKYRPPNHFNCRSLLVAVTRIDDEPDTQDEPTIDPPAGFG